MEHRYITFRRTGKLECVECGVVFAANSSTALYCSGACKMRAYRRRKSQPEAVDLVNSIHAKSKPGQDKTRRGVCFHCGKHFTQGKRARTFCKAGCRVSSNRMKQAATVHEMAYLLGKKMIDAYEYCEQDWKNCYSYLESRNMVYSGNQRTWVHSAQKELF